VRGRADERGVVSVCGACLLWCSVSDFERGQSSANDRVTISTAGSYVSITTPVVETVRSTSFNPGVDGAVREQTLA
jgi:hypothetical protein